MCGGDTTSRGRVSLRPVAGRDGSEFGIADRELRAAADLARAVMRDEIGVGAGSVVVRPETDALLLRFRRCDEATDCREQRLNTAIVRRYLRFELASPL
jgi:hypothetical protein